MSRPTLAIAQVSGKSFLYATNFRSGRVEAYDATFTPVELPGGLLVDPRLPAGYGPFDIAELNGQLYVTFAQQNATLHDDVPGPGHGLCGRVHQRRQVRAPASHPRRAGFPVGPGPGTGRVRLVRRRPAGRQLWQRPHQRLQPAAGVHLGQLRQPDGEPIVIDGLWSLRFGNGNAAKTGQLLFSAGPDGETHGLLGKIVVTHRQRQPADGHWATTRHPAAITVGLGSGPPTAAHAARRRAGLLPGVPAASAPQLWSRRAGCDAGRLPSWLSLPILKPGWPHWKLGSAPWLRRPGLFVRTPLLPGTWPPPATGMAGIRSDLRDFRQATVASFNAMRSDLTDVQAEVRTGFTEVRWRLDGTAAGLEQITGLLNTLIGGQGGQSG